MENFKIAKNVRPNMASRDLYSLWNIVNQFQATGLPYKTPAKIPVTSGMKFVKLLENDFEPKFFKFKKF